MLLGGVACAACDAFLVERFIPVSVMADDLDAFCATTGTLRYGLDPDTGDGSVQRPAFPGAMAALFAHRDGIYGGILRASQLFFALMLAGLYLWGAALGSRTAGVLAVLLATTVGPLALATRSLTFYPAVGALYLIGAALVCLALRLGSVWGVALGSAGLGLTLLGDQMGLVWAAPGLGLLLFMLARMVTQAEPRRRLRVSLAGAGALLLPLVCSWFVAASLPPVTYPGVDGGRVKGQVIKTLEVRAAQNINAHLCEASQVPNCGFPAAVNEELKRFTGRGMDLGIWQRGFLWGHGSPLDWLATPGRLLALTRIEVRDAFNLDSYNGNLPWLRKNNVHPFLLLGGVALLLTLFTLRRQRLLLAGLLLCLLPYLFFLLNYQQMTFITRLNPDEIAAFDSRVPVIYRPKYLTIVLAPLPLLLALPLARAGQGLRSRLAGRLSPLPGRAAGVGAATAGAALVAALLLGWSRTPGPGMRYFHFSHLVVNMLDAAAGKPGGYSREVERSLCVQLLRRDNAAGLPMLPLQHAPEIPSPLDYEKRADREKVGL